MSMKDRMSESTLHKLMSMRQGLEEVETEEKFGFSEDEEESIRNELLQQAEKEDASEEIDDDFFTSLSGPSQSGGNEKLVEVEYLGRIGYVDISFESLDEDIAEEDARHIVDALETMAYESDSFKRKKAAKEVEAYGEKAVSIIFRECRKFDLTDEVKREEIIHLLSRLATRSLKGRKTIKAVLEKASSTQHLILAVMAAGSVREREAVKSILNHMSNPDFVPSGLEALIKIRDKESVASIINILSRLDASRSDLIDQVIQLAPRFSDFGPEAVKPVFDAYIQGENRAIRPFFTLALRSFKEDAVPVLAAVLEDETDEGKLMPICMTLGGLKLSYSTQLLVDAFSKYPNKKRVIVRGLSHTNDSNLVPMLVNELKTTPDIRLKQECLGAIAHLAHNDKELIPVIKPYLSEQRNNLHLDALNCLVRLGDRDSLVTYIDTLMNGHENEQYVLQKHLPKMPFKLMVKMAETMLTCPDEKAILLVTSLQRANIVPQEVGPILQSKLNQNPAPSLKLEIYRLIGKHVNKKKELLSQEVLYKARRDEDDPRVIRELDQIIQNMRKEKGRISTLR
ncbi:hypothetical protein [Exiguobacterium sp. s37]|uniref:hypothetical protein n=1 Tax=Exiguobacterium sp. s37 TaxID=2751275 RepID=UPI001BE513B6|nr:hypothetical protein [Exiguobacterium sp. s37]